MRPRTLLTVAGAFLAGLVAASMLGASSQPPGKDPSVSSRRYEMTDPDGRIRGEWYVDKTSKAIFSLRSPTGETAVTLCAGQSDSAIILADPKGVPRCNISSSAAGTTGVRLLDADQTRVELLSEADKGCRLRIYDKAGKMRFTLSQEGKDQSVMQILNAEGKVVWSALDAK